VIPVDYRAGNVAAQVRQLAPGGVDAVFDHVGGRSVIDSWHLLTTGGTLVAYGSASTRDDTGSKQWPVMKILARTLLWNTLPNGRHAYFYNIWAGRALNKDRFRARLRSDLTEVFAALRRGEVTARIAARLPLTQAAEALRLAESGTVTVTVTGKIVLTS
jgi:NADPH:quinone reductase-like Zn-dependent oxidoreductase